MAPQPNADVRQPPTPSAPFVADMPPASDAAAKRRYVRDMFSAIAPSYDLLNHLLSLNIDRGWRREAVARLGWQDSAGGTYLDACAGTLDLATTLATRRGFAGRIVAADFAVSMLKLGRSKPPEGRVNPAAADALELPFGDSVFDGAMVGFGVRNLADVEAGVRELARVLKPGARLVILDFTTPRFAPLRTLYLFYFRRVLPLVGRMVSGHPTAYSYLPSSVATFASPDQLEAMMKRAGLRETGYRLLTGGIAAVHWGSK